MIVHKRTWMRGLLVSLGVALALSAMRIPVALAEIPGGPLPVDLRDKQGIVDPNDLKKHDPTIPPTRTTGPQESDWLRDQIFQLERMKDKSIADIRKLQDEIRKCDTTIGKSENLARLARQKNNKQAEAIARDAMMKATEAKRKNEETLRFRRFHKELLEKRINERKNLLASIEKNTHENQRTEKETDCGKIEAQLERDKMVMARFMKTIDMTNKEREDWTKEGEDAAWEAGETVVKYFTSGFADMLEKRGGNFKKIEEQISKYEKRAITEKDKYFIGLIKSKLEKAKWHYSAAKSGYDTKIIVKTSDYGNVMKSEFEVRQKMLEKGDQEITELLKDTEVRGNMSDISSFFADTLLDHELEIRKTSGFFKKISPMLAALPMVRDLAYAGLKFHYSLESISQLGEVADQELKAVNALKHQMERTMGKVKECREKEKKSTK